jgi:hypothetical protein
MSERSERIISTGFGEAFYAAPLIGAPSLDTGPTTHLRRGEDR